MNTQNWTNRRNRPELGTPSPMHYSIASYCTHTKHKKDPTFPDEALFNQLSMIANPLQKNLADAVITPNMEKETFQSEMIPSVTEKNVTMNTEYVRNGSPYPFAGITNFISSMFSVVSDAVFPRRARPPDVPDTWHQSRDVNKHEPTSCMSDGGANDCVDMSDCQRVVEQCEDKLNKVRHLLTAKTVPSNTKTQRRRPRRVFVEAGSVEESFVDAFSTEDFVQVSNATYVECVSPANCHQQEIFETQAPTMKTDMVPVHQTIDISTIPDEKTTNSDSKTILNSVNNPEVNIEDKPVSEKPLVVSSCEDKLSALKALLRYRKQHKTSPDSVKEPAHPETRPQAIPAPKVQDKRFKNQKRTAGDKRRKSLMRRNIQDDMSFAHEVPLEDVSSTDSLNITERTPKPSSEELEEIKDYFNEVSGRFHSSSLTDSDDSFQIVFTDSPRVRVRKPSDCDSEDSFIVFEDSPDSCYTSNDVFGDEDFDETECSDAESEASDSGCPAELCKLSHSLSRTVSDLTDDNLYEEDVKALDEVDTSVCTEIPNDLVLDKQSEADLNETLDVVEATANVAESLSTGDTNLDGDDTKLDESENGVAATETDKPTLNGVLLTDAKKLLRKSQPAKTVRFSSRPPEVHVMRVWTFAARQARAGHWERHSLDRERFKRRIADVDMAVSWVLRPQHRSRVMFQRIRPWWHRQRREEAAARALLQQQEEAAARQQQREHADETNELGTDDTDENIQQLQVETPDTPIHRDANEDKLNTQTNIPIVSVNTPHVVPVHTVANKESINKTEQTKDEPVKKSDLNVVNNLQNLTIVAPDIAKDNKHPVQVNGKVGSGLNAKTNIKTDFVAKSVQKILSQNQTEKTTS